MRYDMDNAVLAIHLEGVHVTTFFLNVKHGFPDFERERIPE